MIPRSALIFFLIVLILLSGCVGQSSVNNIVNSINNGGNANLKIPKTNSNNYFVDPEASLEISNVKFNSYSGITTVLGEIKNTGSKNVENIVLDVIDPNSNLKNATLTPASITNVRTDILLPFESAPFALSLIGESSSLAEVKVISAKTTNEQPIRPKIEKEELKKIDDFPITEKNRPEYYITVMLRNTSMEKRYVHIQGRFYDAAGNLLTLAVYDSYSSPGETCLDSQQTKEFKLIGEFEKTPIASYKLSTYSSPYC